MADLYDRLFPDDPGYPDKIAVHYLRAALGDYVRGHTTRVQMVAWWDMDSEAETDLDVLCDDLDGRTLAGAVLRLVELHDVMMIAEAGARYQTKADFRTRLGL